MWNSGVPGMSVSRSPGRQSGRPQQPAPVIGRAGSRRRWDSRMVRRSAWIVTMVIAWSPSWAEPARCRAQSPAIALPSTDPPPGDQPATALPSTVSPVIERFMKKRSGQDIPPPRSLAAPIDPAVRRQASTSIPPPIVPPPAALRATPNAGRQGPAAVGVRAGQDVRGMPPGPPSRGLTTLSPDVAGPPTPRRVSPLATRVTLSPAPRGAHRRPLPDQPGHRLAALRRPAADRGRGRRPGSGWPRPTSTQARVIWIPTLNVAADYLRHDGGGPDFNKGILTAPSVNFFYGGVGLWGVISSTDAIFQPLVARQVLNSRQWDVQAAKNDAVMQTADAYFQVHQYRGTYAGTLYCVEQGHVLVEKLATLSRDLIQEFEVERARNMVADLEQQRRLVAAGVAGAECQPHPGPAARPSRPGRADGAGSPPGHPDRTRPDAGRTDADRHDQPAGDRLAAGDGPVGDGGDPTREDAAHSPQPDPRRLPEPRRHVDPGRDLRAGTQQQPGPVDGPRGRQHPAHVAARVRGAGQPGPDQASSGASSRRPRSTCCGPRTWWRRT